MNLKEINKQTMIRYYRRRTTILRLIKMKHKNGIGELSQIPDKTYHCMNCGEDFQGNFCPRCGQSIREQKLTLGSVVDNLMAGITNVGSGFTRTCIEMFFRPGFMVRDFINGKRIIYFKPFQMLFVLAAVFSVEVALMYPNLSQSNKDDKQTSAADSLAAKSTVKEKSYPEKILALQKSYRDSTKRLQKTDSLTVQIDSIQQELEAKENAGDKNLSEAEKQKEDSLVSKSLQQMADLTVQKKALTSMNDNVSNGDDRSGENSGMESGAFNIVTTFAAKAKKAYEIENDKVNHPYFAAFVSMVKGWITGNRAVTTILLLPFFVLAVGKVYRRRQKNYYNWVELSFAYAYMASQQLLILTVLYLFTVVRPGDEFFIFFVLTIWYLSQMYGEHIKKALWHTCLVLFQMIVYVMLISLIAAVLSIFVIEMVQL